MRYSISHVFIGTALVCFAMAFLPVPRLGMLMCCLIAMLVFTGAIITGAHNKANSTLRKCLLFVGSIAGFEATLQLSPVSISALDRYSSSNAMPLFEIFDNVIGLVVVTFLSFVVLLVLSGLVSNVTYRKWRVNCMLELTAYSIAFAPVVCCLAILATTAI